MRNRVISGLALGVVVVEAPEHSGALITARHAGEQGRGVFAVPGSVNSVQSRGTHNLIRDGATLVNDVNDIVGELDLPEVAPTAPAPRGAPPVPGPAPAQQPTPAEAQSGAPPSAAQPEGAPRAQLSGDEDRLLSVLSLQQKYVDQIIEESRLPSSQVNAALLMLELKGLVRRLPGNLFVRIR
jgi:DNA processing protein